MRRPSICFPVLLAMAVATAGDPLASQTVFRSGVDLVNVTVTVTDKQGRFVGGLKQEDFTILDDGQPQEIVNFSAQRVPVSLGVVLDVSGSMTPEKLSAARIAINRFAFDLLAPADELFLAQFATRTTMLQTWTKNRDTLSRALDRAQTQSRTHLYDAIRITLPVASTGENPKKALLVVSDGDDQTSRTTLKEVQEIIKASEVLVYALGVEGDDGIDAGSLRKLTDTTGGRTEIVKGFMNLDKATSELALELNQQYSIGYAMPHQSDGKWHSIKVTVKGRNLNVRARTGYIAASS
jgi:Ca-activated chloride channel family protein